MWHGGNDVDRVHDDVDAEADNEPHADLAQAASAWCHDVISARSSSSVATTKSILARVAKSTAKHLVPLIAGADQSMFPSTYEQVCLIHFG